MTFFQRHAYGFGAGLASVLWWFFPKRRRLSVDNILKCGITADADEARRIAKKAWCHLAGHIGEALVKDSLAQAKALGFRIMQFNAVVAFNTHARHLYERLGFTQLGTIPGGFRLDDGTYADIYPYYKTLC